MRWSRGQAQLPSRWSNRGAVIATRWSRGSVMLPSTRSGERTVIGTRWSRGQAQLPSRWSNKEAVDCGSNACRDKPPPCRALNRIEQPASGRSPFQASATARPRRAGASPAKAEIAHPIFAEDSDRVYDCGGTTRTRWLELCSVTPNHKLDSVAIANNGNRNSARSQAK